MELVLERLSADGACRWDLQRQGHGHRQRGEHVSDTTANELIVDTKAPTVTVNTLTTNYNQPTLSGTVSDPGPSSGIAGVTIVVNGQTLTATLNGTIGASRCPWPCA